jgi:hypothetical protein
MLLGMNAATLDALCLSALTNATDDAQIALISTRLAAARPVALAPDTVSRILAEQRAHMVLRSVLARLF